MIRKLRMKIEEQEENCRLSLEREHHPRIREEGETTRVEWDGESVIEPGRSEVDAKDETKSEKKCHKRFREEDGTQEVKQER